MADAHTNPHTNGYAVETHENLQAVERAIIDHYGEAGGGGTWLVWPHSHDGRPSTWGWCAGPWVGGPHPEGGWTHIGIAESLVGALLAIASTCTTSPEGGDRDE